MIVRTASAIALLLVVSLQPVAGQRSQTLDGSWSLETYDRRGELDVSGLMVVAEGHFAFVYDMELDGKSARAHGGTYTSNGDRLVFTVPWWAERVGANIEVMSDVREAPGNVERDGDRLTMRFDAGTVQTYRKHESAASDELSGAWLMESYEGQAKTGATSGILVFADGKFALVYTMKPGDGSLDGRGHAGSYERQGDALALTLGWSLHVIGGEAMIEEPGGVHETSVSVTGDSLRLRFADGAVQTFRRARP